MSAKSTRWSGAFLLFGSVAACGGTSGSDLFSGGDGGTDGAASSSATDGSASGSCVTTADCGDANLACFPSDHRCHASCLGDAASSCGGNGGGGNGGGKGGGGSASICDPTSGACVECVTSADCPGSDPTCDPKTQRCQ